MRKHYLSSLFGLLCLSLMASQAQADVEIFSSGQSVICEFRDNAFGDGQMSGSCPPGTQLISYDRVGQDFLQPYVGCMTTVTASAIDTSFESCSFVDDLDAVALKVVIDSVDFMSFESLCAGLDFGQDFTNEGVTTEAVSSGIPSPSNSCFDLLVNEAPIVDAGADQEITLPDDTVDLDGTVSDDGLPEEPGQLSHIWSADGPADVLFEDEFAVATTATFSEAGTYNLTLTADDGELSTSDTLVVQVNAEDIVSENEAPLVDVGPDQTLSLPTNTAVLDASVGDDGLPSEPGELTISWAADGPADVVFADSANPITNATFSAAGTYSLTLTADDGELSASDTLVVQVKPEEIEPEPEPDGAPFPETISTAECQFVQGNGTTGDFGLVSENDDSAVCEVGFVLETTSGETMRTVQRFLRKATEACDTSGGDVITSLFTDNVFPGTDRFGYGAFLRCQVQKSAINLGVFSEFIDGDVVRSCDASCTQDIQQTRQCIGGEVGEGECIGDVSRVVERSCLPGEGLCPINAATRGTIQDNVLIEPDSNEASAAIAIENLCPQLGFGDRNLTSGQQDLLARCENLIAETNDPRQFRALQNIIADEISGQAVNLRRLNLAFLSDITSRLAAMRPALVRSSKSLSLNEQLSHPLPGYAGVSRAEILYQQEQAQMQAGFMHLERGGAAGDEELPDIGRWGIFVNGLFGTGDRNRTRNASSFDFDSYNVTIGADYLLDATTIIGLAIGYGGSDTDFSDNGGSLENDTQSLSLYGTHYFENLWFLDAVIGFGSSDYINRRNLNYIADGVGVNQTTEGRPDGDQTLFSIGVGKTITTGSAIDWDFSLRLNYLDASIDRFAERTLTPTAPGFGLALEIEKQDIQSTTAELGLSVSKAFSRNFGVLVPSFGLSWLNELEDGSDFLTARFVEDPFSLNFVQSGIGGSAGTLPTIFQVALDPNDSSYGRAQLGVNVLLPNSWSFNFVVNKTLGLEAISFEYYSLGVRKSF